jgi:Cof subfamily protein (haloacid dehalogenase superfamily)
MYKLLAIDLDGTLLNEKAQISEGNRLAISQAMEKGIQVVVCTGRIYKGARPFALQIGGMDMIIACNGALIREINSGKIHYEQYLRDEDCIEIASLCEQEEIYYHIYAGDTMIAKQLEKSALFYKNLGNTDLPIQDRVEVIVDDDMKGRIRKGIAPISKVVIISDHADALLRLRNKINQNPMVEVISSKFDNLEVVRKGVSKGLALKYLAEKLGFQREQVIAIGDNENDISMLQYAGFAIAMGNAEEEVKKIADYVTHDNQNDGVANAIQHFLL